jgi:iron transport multicopper oxidase
MGAFAAQYVQFDQHNMTVVEIDGVYTKPYNVTQLFLPAAQRYSVIVHAKPDANQNFAIVVSMDEDMFDSSVIPPGLNNTVRYTHSSMTPLADVPKATGWLVYDKTKPLPKPFDLQYLPQTQDDTVFVPQDGMPALGPVTVP